MLIVLAARTAFACAPAPRTGEEIAIIEESAVIVWDPATQTEHFIRRATFRGKGHDFGFLVPTPAAPALAEVDDAMFDRLEEKTVRETVYTKSRETDWTPFLLWFRGYKETAMTAAPPVQVLQSTKIAGYDAVVLAATDSAALQKWLEDHGYAASEDLAQWLDAYVRQQWTITAFKIDANDTQPRTAAVKMSFHTARPYFPYREPVSQKRIASDEAATRALRIWFIGPERVTAAIGDGTFWPGILRRSEPLRVELAQLTLPPNARMTAFIDQSTVRPGNDELYFVHSANQSAFIPPPVVIDTVEKTHIPLDVVILIAGAIAFFVIRARSSARSRPT